LDYKYFGSQKSKWSLFSSTRETHFDTSIQN